MELIKCTLTLKNYKRLAIRANGKTVGEAVLTLNDTPISQILNRPADYYSVSDFLTLYGVPKEIKDPLKNALLGDKDLCKKLFDILLQDPFTSIEVILEVNREGGKSC